MAIPIFILRFTLAWLEFSPKRGTEMKRRCTAEQIVDFLHQAAAVTTTSTLYRQRVLINVFVCI